MIINNASNTKYSDYISNLYVFFVIQVILTIILAIIVNFISYPLNLDEDMQVIATVSLIIFILRNIYIIYVGWQWGIYKLNEVLYSFFRPFFYYSLFILLLSMILQILFPSITGILFWPMSNFLLIEIDGFLVYIYLISVVITNNSGGDAIILFYLLLGVLGMIVIPIMTIFTFLIGFKLFKIIKKNESRLNLQKIDKLAEIKYLFFSLAIIGTFFLLIIDFSHSTFMNGQVELPPPISFIIFECIGLAGLVVLYLSKKRDFSRN